MISKIENLPYRNSLLPQTLGFSGFLGLLSVFPKSDFFN